MQLLSLNAKLSFQVLSSFQLKKDDTAKKHFPVTAVLVAMELLATGIDVSKVTKILRAIVPRANSRLCG